MFADFRSVDFYVFRSNFSTFFKINNLNNKEKNVCHNTHQLIVFQKFIQKMFFMKWSAFR